MSALSVPALVAAPASLPSNLQTGEVMAVGTMVGAVGMRLLNKLLELAPVPAALPVESLPLPTVPVDPASWFSAAALAAPAATLPVHYAGLSAAKLFWAALLLPTGAASLILG